MGKEIIVLVLCLAIVVLNAASAQVPAVFVLGDSTADIGTNNFLSGSGFKADFLPYGIDFPRSTPTGRFSNGFNSADFLAKLVGFKRSPLPYFILANNTKLIKRPSFRGVNFASAGCGIFNITGQPPNSPKNVITLGEQMDQLSSICSELVANLGQEYAQTFLSKSLFFVSIGSNDVFAYYLSKSAVPKEDFIASLGLAYETYLRSLYKLGARKFGIISVPPIGCCPSMRSQNPTGACLGDLNSLATDFYSAISALLVKLSSEYKDIIYSLGNAYEMTVNVIDNPSPFGFVDVKNACCGDAKVSCGPNATYCSDRRQYLFWDSFHPTMKASWLAAITLYTGEPRFVSPINFKQLVEA